MLHLRAAVWTLLLMTIPRIGMVIANAELPPSFDPADYPDDSVIIRDVAIIGGGSTGVYTAIRAKDSHKSVVIIEKKDRLGGHTETYTDPATGLSINYGVIIWHDLPVVRNYFARLNITLTKLDLSALVFRYVDFATGKDTPGFPRDFSDGVAAYAAQLAKYPSLDAGFFLPDPVPADLLLPFAEYVEKYPALKPIAYYLFVSAQGLGDSLQLPMLYVFKNWGLDVLRNVEDGFVVPTSGDNSELYRNAGAVLGAPALLFNSCVIATQRKAGAKYVKVVVKTPSGRKLILARKLVITIPPLPEQLRGFDLGNEELSLFKRFSSKAYYTGIVRDPGIPGTLPIRNAAADTLYNIPRLPGFYNIGPSRIPGLIDFKYGSDEILSDAQVKANVIADLERLHQVGTFNQTVQPEIFIYSSHSPFQLNVPARDIADGFYRKLYALQGQRQTYYTGAAFHTHDSSLLWNFTEANVIPKIIV